MDDTTPKTSYWIRLCYCVFSSDGFMNHSSNIFLDLPCVVISFRSYEFIDCTTPITYYLVCCTYFTKLIIFNQQCLCRYQAEADNLTYIIL